MKGLYDIVDRSPIRAVIEACTNAAGGDVDKGRVQAAIKLGQLFESGKLDVDRGEFSIKEAFDNFVGMSIGQDTHPKRVAEAITTSAFPYITTKALAPKAIEAYKTGLAGADALVEELGPVTERDAVIPGLTATDGIDLVGEAQAYTYAYFGEKYCLVLQHKFGKIAGLTKEALAYDKTGMLVSQAKGLAEKGGAKKHEMIVQKAFGIACTATGEGATNNFRYKGTAAAIFADTHAATDGQVNDNISTTAFSTAGIKDLYVLLRKQVDEQGDYITNIATHLCVPVELNHVALQALTSAAQYDTANRATNVLPQLITGGAMPQIFSSPVLDGNSVTLYYLGSPRKQTVWAWTQQLKTESQGTSSDEAFKSDIVFQWKVSYIGNAASTDYRRIVRGGT